MWQLWLSIVLSYLALTWYTLVKSVEPGFRCTHPQAPCYRPLVTTGQRLTMELWLRDEQNWFPVPTCRMEMELPETGRLPKLITGNGTKCEVPIPDSARHRSPRKELVRPLQAEFVALAGPNSTEVIARVPFELTRVIERRPRGFWSTGTTNEGPSRKLLQEPLAADLPKKGEITEPTWIPFLKYGRAAIRLRFVAEDRPYGRGPRGVLQRADGLQIQPYNRTRYSPIIYVDDLSLQRSAQVELAPPEDGKPPVPIQIKISSLSPIFDSILRQTHQAFEVVEDLFPGEELDEMRYFLQDERLYRFLITQVISYLHITLDYLAFRDEITFYRGRKNLSGVSTSSAIIRFLCSAILFLYLLDGDGTSWIVLGSMLSSCGVDGWKVWKLLNPRLIPRFPFVAVRELQTGKEQETASYDRIAFVNLAMVLYPLVVGWSLYALQHYEYKSWYSWLISNLANAVYTFGFISLCPQLYINYRLKSVAHLPWKVFLYKIFNTFVDDAFAWIIEMPWKHRIMTLRDDVIFVLFLVQVYMYRVDKTRTNEFGYAYEEEESGGEGTLSKDVDGTKEKVA